ncbi:MAG: universal stress protein [Marmoricola sp.]
MTENQQSPQQRSGLVVVGVSARSKSPTALRWAADYAASHDARLEAVRAWRPGSPQDAHNATSRSDALATLRSDVAAVLGEDHGAQVRLVEGGRRRVLLDAAADADLLVVDAPRGLATDGPGLVQRLLHGLDCPLVVVPRSIAGLPPSRVGMAARAMGRSVTEAAGRAPRAGLGHLQP